MCRQSKCESSICYDLLMTLQSSSGSRMIPYHESRGAQVQDRAGRASTSCESSGASAALTSASRMQNDYNHAESSLDSLVSYNLA